MKLRRLGPERYTTRDGAFTIWREFYAPRRWYVNHVAYDETLTPCGYPTKWEAVQWLEKNQDDYRRWAGE